MKRFFSFGCSFTSYKWPTWADMLGRQFEHFENWGKNGGGNLFILNSLIECHLKKQINKQDVVGIMWTNVTREDRYVDGKWLLTGNVFTSNIYDSNFIKKFADVRGYYIRDLALIYAAQQILDSIGCRYYFFSMVPMTNVDQYCVDDGTDAIVDILPYYKQTLDKIYPSVYEVVFNFDWSSRVLQGNESDLDSLRKEYEQCAGPEWPSFEQVIAGDFDGVSPTLVDEILDKNRWDWKNLYNTRYRRIDSHPTPMEHIEFVDQTLGANEISPHTRQWARQIEHRIRSGNTYDDLWTVATQERW